MRGGVFCCVCLVITAPTDHSVNRMVDSLDLFSKVIDNKVSVSSIGVPIHSVSL